MVKTSEMSMELKQELAFTKEELAELEAAKKMPITFDADCPETTPERAVKFRRVNPPRNRMASHGEQNNEQHQHQRNEQARLHRLHFPLTYSSCHRPEAATDDQIPVSVTEDPVPSGRLASKWYGNE